MMQTKTLRVAVLVLVGAGLLATVAQAQDTGRLRFKKPSAGVSSLICRLLTKESTTSMPSLRMILSGRRIEMPCCCS